MENNVTPPVGDETPSTAAEEIHNTDAKPAAQSKTRIILAVCVMALSIVLIALGIALACSVETDGVAQSVAIGELSGYIATACLGGVALVLATVFLILGLKRKQ